MRTRILLLLLAALLLGCSFSLAVPVASVETAALTAAPVTASIAPTETPAPTPEPTPTAEPTPEPTETPVPTPEPTPTPRFADKFITGEPVVTEDSYQSERVAIFLTHIQDDSGTFSRYPLAYHMADIYLKEPTDFRAAFTNEDFRYKYAYPMASIVESNNALLAISGDFIRFRSTGLCVRNGTVYRTVHDPTRDVCVFYRDGHIEMFDADATPVDTILSDPEVWHVIGFGPSLLDENGKAKESFHTSVAGHNPRAVIGYYEPGHYALLYVEGRQEGYSQGLRMEGLSKLCESLGFTAAFNLDGGNTAGMYFCGNPVGRHVSKRELHDIFYIAY